MAHLDPTPYSNGSVNEIVPFGAAIQDGLPSFSSILGAGSDEVIGLSPEALSLRIRSINEFYEGLEAPYISAEALIRRSLREKQIMPSLLSSDKKEKAAAEQEIEALRDGLRWALKKISVLEEERKTLVSRLK